METFLVNIQYGSPTYLCVAFHAVTHNPDPIVGVPGLVVGLLLQMQRRLSVALAGKRIIVSLR
jgi:hypothetical protein